jgi:shikimate dehydrogenase
VAAPAARTVARLQPLVENTLDRTADKREVVCGIIGDHPSEYAKSPGIWTAAFEDLGTDAIYLPFDVTKEKLPSLVDALRHCDGYVGGNVTVPYKVAVMDLLDELDPAAAQIGAVNTICKTSDGRLIGYNTDADGALGSLLRPTPWQAQPLLATLDGLRVLLIGAGGAARATAFAVASQLGDRGSLAIANRSQPGAQALAAAVSAVHGNAEAVDGGAVSGAVASADLVINASVVGQSGIRRLAEDRLTCLEPYSPLAPANAVVFAASAHPSDAGFYRAWFDASSEDIAANQRISARAVVGAPAAAAFFDLIYSPLETTFLRQARLSGHATLNGKGMNIIQAVEAFVTRVMAPRLNADGWKRKVAYARVFQAMLGAW